VDDEDEDDEDDDDVNDELHSFVVDVFYLLDVPIIHLDIIL